jgi:anaerobic sulfite reductase subunit A
VEALELCVRVLTHGYEDRTVRKANRNGVSSREKVLMKVLRLDGEQAEGAFHRIANDYTVIAPQKRAGRGRYSDSDLVTYEKVESLCEIELSSRTYFSAKSVLFPIREAMFSFKGDTLQETPADIKPTIVFLRSCDIHALGVLDAMFLEHGAQEDCYYLPRREKMTCFLLECPQPFDECFCVSMGTNRTQDYAVFLRQEAQGYAVQILDDKFQQYFPHGAEERVEPRFARKDPAPISIPGRVDISLFTDTLWEEYSQRCIACGRCNTSCPTCSCFTIQNIPDSNDPRNVTRQRIWSSCQVKHFSRLAGNHEFRIPKGQRMRYKVLHKIYDFTKTFGFPMCVGCGRCEEVCPEYIGMRKCIERIAMICSDNKGLE